MHVPDGHASPVNQATLAFHAGMPLHTKVPLIGPLGRVHLRAALADHALSRGRYCDQRYLDDRATGNFDSLYQQPPPSWRTAPRRSGVPPESGGN